MSIETRSNSALFKRAEQLKRWEDSDTNREPVSPKQKSRKIKFSSGCVFLAACAAGDKEEVLRLIQKGADIDTANVDGLTALHQACIDDNLDMVEFLVEHSADVNRGDNEGWTPLHATASCGLISIAKYLLEHGANVAAVNNDGELALDITECDRMSDLLQAEIDERGIDCEEARCAEEKLMLRDAREHLGSNCSLVDALHPKTGATALHVASAKGYLKVIKILLQCRSDVDKQDFDGWTPLHAAAHWGQKEAAQLLVDNLADMDLKNYVGQTAFDVADTDMFRYLEEIKKRQNKEEVLNKRQTKKRAETQERQNDADAETPTKLKKVEVEIEGRNEEKIDNNTEAVEKKNKANAVDSNRISSTDVENSITPKQPPNENNEESLPSWRRSLQTRPRSTESPTKSNSFRIDKKNPTLPNEPSENDSDVVLRRTNSFQSDEKPTSNKEEPKKLIDYADDSTPLDTTTATTTSSIATPTSTVTSTTTGSPTTSPVPSSQVRRSFVPPVRDEESETQRKAHAKRVRETRRSTQGVTLEEIKSAEQLVKKKNQPSLNNNNEQPGANGESTTNGPSVTATITTATPTVPTTPPKEIDEPPITHERRPSWRLRVDNGSKFKLEDATSTESPTPPAPSAPYSRRPIGGIGSSNTPIVSTTTTTTPRPVSAPVDSGAETTFTLPLRRPKSQDDKEQDKENDARNAQATLATQATIQRRRRPKRRSTGVVHLDNMDDLDPDQKDPTGGGDNEDVKLNHEDSGTERTSRSSRVGSTSDLPLRGENGEIDYKKLYEQAQADNDRLRDKLRKSDEDLRETKQTLEKINTVTSKNSLSELEKRERRAMERKLSEMEEELKHLELLKSENQRLKDENGALIRVISKLSK